MKTILCIKKQVEEEFKDAENYICCATHYKADYPELADTYQKLSAEEYGHASELYARMSGIIEDYKKTKSPSECMLEMWNEFKEDYIQEAAHIKMMQDIYKMTK